MQVESVKKKKMVNLIWISLVFSISYWILEAVRDVLVFEKGGIVERIFIPDMLSFWMRLLVVCIITLFGIYSQSVRKKLDRQKAHHDKPLRMMHILQAGIAFGILYWILESIRDVFVFGKGNIFECILSPDPIGIWMRLLGIFVLILFSVYAQKMIIERKQAEEALKKYNEQLEQHIQKRTEELTYSNSVLKTELSKREKSLNKLIRHAELLEMLTKCDQLIIRHHDDSHLLSRICSVIINLGDYHLVWICMSEKEENINLDPVAWSGKVKGDKQLIMAMAEARQSEDHPIVQAFRSRKPCIIRLSETHEVDTYSQKAFILGYRAFLSLPLLLSNHIFGTLNFFGKGLEFSNADEVGALQDLALDVTNWIKLKHNSM